MIKKILISLLFVYIIFADIIISVLEINSLKSILSALIFFLTFIYFSINYKKLIFKQFIIVPIFLIVVFILIWKDLGYINLFYTTIFGYILAQDYSFSKRMLLFTSIIQLILTLYEKITLSVIYTKVVSGVVNKNSYDYGKSFELFDATGFRPKGLFPGTLIGTSFIIYLAMFYRNNIRILLLLFASAIIINGR
ncbi:MAG: hypothetical protein P8I26_05050, partial [Flavobacteriaceae bacterium]|nr:hypothetical protein [Flavobacteriaceae bacterium]